MKILSALKKIKHLDRKIEKNLKLISKYCSIVMSKDEEKPAYDGEDIRKMLQRIGDLSSEKAAIRSALHLTNVNTEVMFMEKICSIDQLLLVQNVTIPDEMRALKSLCRKTKSGGFGQKASKDEYVLTQFDPRGRDKEIEKLEDVQHRLDELLDNTNIETDVIGLG